MEALSGVSERSFVKGLLATLRLFELETLPTIGDRHQRAFAAAVKILEERRAAGDKATERMPRWFPGPITGKYEEFDTAILALQNVGITRPVGPYFTEVELPVTQERAEGILKEFTPEEQHLLADLSTEFVYEVFTRRS